jgi:sugar O-acyltransferase (sialic acid O-acetyltransferase NeuD family)
MATIVFMPKVSVNDESAVLAAWDANNDEYVNKGQIICVVETSKAALEIEAESSGYLIHLAKEGDMIDVGKPIGVIRDTLEEEIEPLLKKYSDDKNEKIDATGFTLKAKMMIKAHSLNERDLIQKFPGRKITKSDIEKILRKTTKNEKPGMFRESSIIERVVILGGVNGGGAEIVADSLLRDSSKTIVGILDKDETTQGKMVMGIKVIGSSEKAADLHKNGMFDSVIIAFNSNLKEREKIYHKLKSSGIRFCNVIDGTVNKRNGVRIGEGNVILSNCYLGPSVKIGNNNFISSNTVIEHHCILGDHCSFGPSVIFSGRVSVGNGVKFGTSISAEPDVHIGEYSSIPSGIAITNDIPAHSKIKKKIDYIFR